MTPPAVAEIEAALDPRALVVARALATADGLGEHMPDVHLTAWMRHALIAVRTLDASAARELATIRAERDAAEAIGFANGTEAAAKVVWRKAQVTEDMLISDTSKDRMASAIRALATPPAASQGDAFPTCEGILAALRSLRRAVEETGIHHATPSVRQAMDQATVVLGRGY